MLLALSLPATGLAQEAPPAEYTRPTLGVACEATDPPPLPTKEDPFAAHRLSLQVLGGGYVSTGVGPRGPSFNHTPVAARLGYTLLPPAADRCFGGSAEVLMELLAAPVTRGPGHVTLGPALLLRYNFDALGCGVVPYVQAGAGIVYNDGYRDLRYRMFGKAQEFLLQTQLGLRFALSPDLSLDVEGGWQHISNGSTAVRNGGANVFGGSVGLTYSFR